MTNGRTPEPIVDAALVQAKIRELEALELGDRRGFAEALITNVMEPDPIETLAFRSDELAFKSLAALRAIQADAQSYKRRRRRGSQKQLATEAFINNMGRERRIIENIVNGIRAKSGQLPNQPNPRRRAERRMWNLNMRGEAIPPGTWRRLLEEEQEKDRNRKRDQKKARQQARKAEGGVTV